MSYRIRTLLAIMLGGCLFVPAVTMPLLEITVYIRPTQLGALFFPEEHPKESPQPSRLRPFFKSLLQGLTTASSAGTDGRAPKSAPLLRGSRTGILTPEGTLEIWHKQRSIVGIIGELCRQKHFFVAFAGVYLAWQVCREGSSYGGASDTGLPDSWGCSQAVQRGSWISPGNGFGFRQRFWAGVAGMILSNLMDYSAIHALPARRIPG